MPTSKQVVPVYVAVSIVKAVDTFCVNNALDPRTFIEGVLRDAVTPSLDQGAVL